MLFQGGPVGSALLSAPLPNKKRWELFVSARFACNGIDTLNSDTVFVDDLPPAMILLDSVSVDLASQRVVAGWKKAPEADVMGYSVFKVDPGTGNNVLVKDTAGLAYRFLTSTFDSRNPGHKIIIAVFDSCKNGGVLCPPHSPVCATINPAENTQYRCSRKVLLRWTAYVGWLVDHYDIWYASSRDNLFYKAGSVSGDTLQFYHPLPELNYTYTYFVRAHKTAGVGITSTSNVVLFLLPITAVLSKMKLATLRLFRPDLSRCLTPGSHPRLWDLKRFCSTAIIILLPGQPSTVTFSPDLGAYWLKT